MPLSFVALWLAGALAAAPPPQDPNCQDDRGVDRCSEEQQRRQRKLYDARTIEEHAARGDWVRRVFYVDGYGNDTAMISFARTSGRDIALEVRTPARAGSESPPLAAAVPLGLWEEIIAGSAHFDRTLGAPAGAEPDLCLHSWVYTAEASDAPRYGQDRPTVRRAVEDACQRGLVQTYALRLAQQALDLLPPCRAIDPQQHRNAVAVLAACARLSGDRIAAAQALNALGTMPAVNESELTDQVRSSFGHRVRFEIAGRVTEHDWSDAAPFWLAQRQALGGRFMAESFQGERWDRVLVRGHLWQQGEGGKRPARAPMQIVMGWEPSQRFLIQQIDVGAFSPAP